MRRLGAALICPMLACQPFDDVGVLGQGDSLLVASELRFFSLYGVTGAAVEVVLARDAAGAILEIEGQTADGLLLPPDEYCSLASVIAVGAAAAPGVMVGVSQCSADIPPGGSCSFVCGRTTWRVTVR